MKIKALDFGYTQEIRLPSRSGMPPGKLKGNYETEAQGECEINGDVIRAMIAPQKRVTYRLYFTYKVAEEILMDCIEVVAE